MNNPRISLKQAIELVGNYPQNEPQIGTITPHHCSFFSNVSLTLFAIHGIEGTSECPFDCDNVEDKHEHKYGVCKQNCVHKGDDSAPNDGKYDFTVSLETSKDGQTWSVLKSCAVTPKEGHGPFCIDADLQKAQWVRISAKSNQPTSNADIMLVGPLDFS